MNSTNLTRKFHLLKGAKWLLFLTLWFITAQLEATIRYVMYGGSGTKSGLSWANASDLLRQTIDNAQNGDEVWVAGGDNTNDGQITYNDHFRMDFKMVIQKDIKIYGGFPRPNVKPGVSNPQMKDRNMVLYATIFDGTIMFAAPVKSLFEQPNILTNALFDGFYVVNASDDKGAGIRMKDGLTISNCVFANNRSTSATEGGGAIYMEGGTLVNCIISNNECANKGAAIYAKGNSKVINCTVVNNKTNGADGRAVCLDGTSTTIDNTLFWNNGGSGSDAAYTNGATVAQIRHCSYNNLPGSSSENTAINTLNIGVNAPYFVNPNAWQGIHTETVWGQSVPGTNTYGNVNVFLFKNLGDWYLQDARSVMFDKGDKSLLPAFLTMDIENNPRVRNKLVDIGCYELQPINITGWVFNNPKVYNGNNYGSMSSNGAVTPAIANVGIDSIMVRYNDKNVGNKTADLKFILNGSESAKFFAEDTTISMIPGSSVPVQITPMPITVTANTGTKSYGDADPATLTFTSSFDITHAGDVWSGALSRTSGETVAASPYTISQNTLLAGNNYTITFVQKTFTITKRAITLTATAGSTKVYGTADPLFNSSISVGTFASGDAISGNPTRVAGNNVGSYSINNFSLILVKNGATDNTSNYAITSVASPFTITPANLSYTSVIANNKTYDATTTASLTLGTLNGKVGADDVTVSSLADFNTKNVGSAIPVNATFSLAGAASANYTITQPTLLTAKISKRDVDALGFGIKDKEADGNTIATVNSWGILTPVPAIDNGKVAINTLPTTPYNITFNNPVAGAAKPVTISVTTPLLLTGVEASNYNLIQPTGLKAAINGSQATFVWPALPPLANVYNGVPHPVTVTVSNPTATNTVATVTYTFANGTALPVSNPVPIEVGSYILIATSNDATWTGSETTTLTITPKPLVAATFANNGTKVYDTKTTVDTQPALVTSGDFARDAITAIGDLGNYNNQNAGINKRVTIKNITLTGLGKDNYTIVDTAYNDTWIITKKDYIDIPATISFANQSKIYDATTKVLPDSSATTINIVGFLPGDQFTAQATQAFYDNKNAGTNKTVTLNNIVYSGNASNNYILPNQILNNNCTILPREFGQSNGDSLFFNAQTKPYDGNTSVKPSIPTINIAGLLSSDVVNLVANSAHYDTKQFGLENKTVTLFDLVKSGADNGNYTFPDSVRNNKSSITKRSILDDPNLKIDFGNQQKRYDGTTFVLDSTITPSKVTIPNLTVAGAIPGDDVIAKGTQASYDNKNIGVNKTVTVRGITLSGLDGANYQLADSAQNSFSSITKRSLDANIYILVADTAKEYNGTTDVTVPTLTIRGLIGGDVFFAIRNTASASFDTKDVGTNKTVTVTGFTFSNPFLAANYTWPPALQNLHSEITAHPLDASIYIEVAKTTKTYNGTTQSAVPTLTIHGLIGGDNFTVIGKTASFDNKDALQNKTVTVTGFLFSNPALALNYTWQPNYSNNASEITPLAINVTPLDGQKRRFNEVEQPFNFTTNPSILPNGETLNGLLSREAGNEVGFYNILQGTVDNTNNPNFDITFTPNIPYEIYSGIVIEKKWGYTLVINDSLKSNKAYQWYKNGNPIAGETLQWYSKEKPLCGIYKVLITLNNNMQVFSQEIDETATCTKSANLVSVTPTLVKPSASITVSGELNEAIAEYTPNHYTISIYTFTGVKVASYNTEQLNSFSFEAPALTGTYIVKIENSNSSEITQKIVVY